MSASEPTADLSALRREYAQGDLGEGTIAPTPTPTQQFAAWFADAQAAPGIEEPNAMTLATADAGGRPSARVVLLKHFDEDGFVFYTNYRSRKGRELADNPEAALTFWWAPLERQVRVEGRAQRLPEDASDAYFRERPRGSRLGAHASPQSDPIESRAALERAYAEVEARFEGQEDVPRPPHWGGVRVRPTAVEFWQGRPSRLHDRLRYRRPDADAPEWTIERLAP